MAFDAVTYAAAKQSAKQYTDQKVSELPSSYTYKGKVATAANLPLSGNTKGDLWITEDDGHEYVWSSDEATGTLENWVDKSKDISNKIDKPEDQANNDTLIYDEENDTWVASSLKSINGQSLLGNGDVEIKTYQAYPSVWQTSGTLEEVTESMLQYPQYTKKGMAYLGGISGTCTPFGEGNAECIVSFMLDGIAVLTVSSSNIAPYRWEYNTASYDYIWKKSADVVANPEATAVDPLTKISINGELYKIEGREYSAGTNITITNDTINAKDTTYSAGNNITINENNEISAKVESFDDKTLIKEADDKYQTAVGGWKEVTPEQQIELFVNTKGNGMPTYINTRGYEVGWDYNTTITSLVSGATTATIRTKFTVLGTIFNNSVVLTKTQSIPANWESTDLTIGGKVFKIKVYDNYVGEHQGGLGLISSDETLDISDSIMESFALVTAPSSEVYHPIDNKFLKIDNSLAVDTNNELKVNTETIQSKLSAGSNITITEATNGTPVISAKDTTYTAGTHVSIANEVITADDNLQQQIVVTNAIGDIAAGEVLPVGTSLEQIVRRMLAGSTPPVTGVSFYWGAIDEDVPTLASLNELNVSVGLDKETLIANGLEKNIVSYYIPALDLGQVQLIAVSNSLKLKDWKNKATGWSYKGNYTAIALGNFNVYYFNQRVDSEPDGEDMKFEFEEA